MTGKDIAFITGGLFLAYLIGHSIGKSIANNANAPVQPQPQQLDVNRSLSVISPPQYLPVRQANWTQV